MIAGKNLLIKKNYNTVTGGFGLWSPKSTSVFHTALILGLFGKMSKFVSVPDKIINAACSYLEKHQNQDGSFACSAGSYTPFPSLLSDEATSIYVAQSLALAGKLNDKLVSWMVSNVESYVSDVSLASMALEALACAGLVQKYKDVANQLRDSIVSSHCETGGWESTSVALTHGKESIETTAYAIVALNKAFPDKSTAVITDKAVEFIMSKRQKNGYGSTRDTLYAVMAFASIKDLVASENASGSLKVTVNDKLFKEFKLNDLSNATDVLAQLKEISIPPEHIINGTNKIDVEASKTFGCRVLVENRVWPKSNLLAAKSSNSIGSLSYNFSKNSIATGEPVGFNVDFVPSETTTPLEAIMFEIPLPSGFSLEGRVKTENPDILDYIEEKKNMSGETRLCCHASLIQNIDKVSISGKMKASFSGTNITVNQCIAYPMYDVSQGVSSQEPSTLVVS